MNDITRNAKEPGASRMPFIRHSPNMLVCLFMVSYIALADYDIVKDKQAPIFFRGEATFDQASNNLGRGVTLSSGGQQLRTYFSRLYSYTEWYKLLVPISPDKVSAGSCPWFTCK